MSKDESKAAFDEDGLNALESEVLGGIQQDAEAVGDIQQGAVVVDEEMSLLVAGVLGMGFAVLAPNWQVQQQEVEQLTEAYTALLSKYCPDGLGGYGVEIAAIMMTFAVVAPRLSTPRAVPPLVEGDGGMPDVLSDEA